MTLYAYNIMFYLNFHILKFKVKSFTKYEMLYKKI